MTVEADASARRCVVSLEVGVHFTKSTMLRGAIERGVKNESKTGNRLLMDKIMAKAAEIEKGKARRRSKNHSARADDDVESDTKAAAAAAAAARLRAAQAQADDDASGSALSTFVEGLQSLGNSVFGLVVNCFSLLWSAVGSEQVRNIVGLLQLALLLYIAKVLLKEEDNDARPLAAASHHANAHPQSASSSSIAQSEEQSIQQQEL